MLPANNYMYCLMLSDVKVIQLYFNPCNLASEQQIQIQMTGQLASSEEAITDWGY